MPTKLETTDSTRAMTVVNNIDNKEKQQQQQPTATTTTHYHHQHQRTMPHPDPPCRLDNVAMPQR
jgi:hypothetical protein